MYRCLNAGNIGVSLTWEACLPLAKAAGFAAIDIPVAADTDVAKVRDALAGHGMKAGGQALPCDFRGTEAVFADGLQSLRAVADKAAAIGQTRFYIWIWPFSDTLAFKDNFRFHAERLGRAAAILGDAGCRLGLEFLGPRHYRAGHPFSFIHTMRGMMDLAEAVGPNAGLLLDSWHWHTSLGTVDEIRALKNEDIVYVHINDAPPGIPVENQYDYVRAVPGETGVQDLPGFLAALRAIGYDGPVVPEPFVSALSSLAPDAALRRVAAGLDRVWDARPRSSVPSMMKAVAIGGRKARCVDLPVPSPQGNEVIVKLHAAPLCGSNLGNFLGDVERVNDGHEGAGDVVAVAESQLLRVGDRVALAPLNACGRCPDCLRGDVIFCRQRPRIHGTFAQYTRVADVMCARIPDDLGYDHASLMGCALGPAYEALKRLGVRGFDTLVVSGLGPVGLGATALGSAMGARVLALDPEPYRRELAARLGAADVFDPTQADARDVLLRAVGEGGIRKSIDCSGKESSERMLIDLAAIRGAVAFIGENHGTIALSPSRDMIRKGLTLLGCWHMNMLDAPALVEFLRLHPAKAELMISHRFPFAQAQEAFAVFATRQTAKVILHPHADGCEQA